MYKLAANMEASPASAVSVEAHQNSGEDLFAEIAKISTTLSASQTRLDEAESRIANVEDSNTSMANDNKVLQQRVDQLESC